MTTYYLYQTLTINSIFHFLFPCILGFFLKNKWKWGILVLIIFELLENLSGITFSLGAWEIFSKEPLINILADLTIGTLGLWVGTKLRKN